MKYGLFSSAYYQYTVETNPIGYKVVRKVSDFHFLYTTLPLINAAVYNPLLPHFEFMLKDDSPKKILYFKNYINAIVESRFFRSLPIVLKFLSLSQEDWNKLRYAAYAKLKAVPLQEIPTLEGEFHIKINKVDDEKAIKIKEDINKKTEAFNNLNTIMDELIQTLEKLSTIYNSLTKSLSDLSNAYKDNDKLRAVFNRLLGLSQTFSQDYIKEKDLLRDEYKYFFKYICKENISFLQKFEEFKSSRDEYKSKFEKMKKMPIKTPKDLEIFQKLRRNYGLELLMVNSEYDKLIERHANRCLNQFMRYNDNRTTLLHNFQNCLKLLNINEDIPIEEKEVGNEEVNLEASDQQQQEVPVANNPETNNQ